MIFGRPANLIVGAFQAVLGAVVLALGALEPPIVIPATVVAAVVIAFGAVIALVANQPPTLNPGDTLNVTTPAGQPTAVTTVAVPPQADQPPVMTPVPPKP
jgi:heme A synthase